MSSALSSKIEHVVIIVQENRTVNDLFNAFPGALTVRTAKNSFGQTVQLRPIALTAPYDISHRHDAFNTEFDHGKGDGFNLVQSGCRKGAHCPPKGLRAYGYVPKAEVLPYYVMASRYTFANHMFQTNQGPSFPAHQYLVSGTSTISDGSPLRAAENPLTPQGHSTGGCDSPSGSTVVLIDPQGNETQTAPPCFDRNSLMALIDNQPNLSWHYYQNHLGPGLWMAPAAVLPIYQSKFFSTDVVAPPAQILKDVGKGYLANVTWVTPTGKASDHPNATNGTGPAWVASVVNKIGESKFWKTTAIFVTWDDWGGWFDPFIPTVYNSYELGFRVPLIVISPYAKIHYISSAQHEFGSILKFTEETFGLPSLGTTDVRADDLADCFNFTGPPHKFVPIPSPHGESYFLAQPVSDDEPDDY
ncbi:MAG: hypothetical protein JO263_07480 [Candidatus Eremiobacteraeota bacterium]|nr:hypothetical protein [Candidatus Eremiobacteraeota bacterium]